MSRLRGYRRIPSSNHQCCSIFWPIVTLAELALSTCRLLNSWNGWITMCSNVVLFLMIYYGQHKQHPGQLKEDLHSLYPPQRPTDAELLQGLDVLSKITLEDDVPKYQNQSRQPYSTIFVVTTVFPGVQPIQWWLICYNGWVIFRFSQTIVETDCENPVCSAKLTLKSWKRSRQPSMY